MAIPNPPPPARFSVLSYDLIENDYAKVPPKPVIDGEPLYEDFRYCWDPGNGFSTAHDVRKFAYWAVFAGALGHTYGHHNIWPFTTGPHPMKGTAKEGNWKDFLNAKGAAQMKHLRALMESRPFLTGIPDQSIVGPAGTGFARIQATRASDGAYLMVYDLDGRPFTADLDKLSGTSVRAYWYDPRTGASTVIENVPKGSLVPFDPPSNGDAKDWVLVVDDAAKNFGDPGQ